MNAQTLIYFIAAVVNSENFKILLTLLLSFCTVLLMVVLKYVYEFFDFPPPSQELEPDFTL